MPTAGSSRVMLGDPRPLSRPSVASASPAVAPPPVPTGQPLRLSVGSGRSGQLVVDGVSEWVLSPSKPHPGEYFIASAADRTQLLSAHALGRNLHLVRHDDGSGRQRWRLRWISRSCYALFVGGGKSDSARKLVGEKLRKSFGHLAIPSPHREEDGWCLSVAPPSPPPPPPPPPSPHPEPKPAPGRDHFPTGILESLEALTSLSAEQLTSILMMVAGPEQARREWWLDASGKSIYGYAEALGDGRGVTLGLYGATTGRGYDDAAALWAAYGRPEYGRLSDDDIVEKVGGLASDPAWAQAMWRAYIDTYWRPVVQNAPYGSALTVGAMLDTAMNAGLGDDSPRAWGLIHLVHAASERGGGESGFLGAFLELRTQYPVEHSGDQRQRIRAWQSLLNDGKWDMVGDLGGYVYIP